MLLAESIRAAVEALKMPNPRAPTSPWVTVSVDVSTIVPGLRDRIEDLFVSASRAMDLPRLLANGVGSR